MRSWVSNFVLSLAFAFVLAGWCLVGWISWGPWLSANGGVMAINGQYGDTFGSINSLFAGLAFVALIYTLKLQQDQIKHAGDSSGISQFFELTRYLDTIRDDRRTVFSHSESAGLCLSWTPDQQQVAEKACAALNLAGILAQEDDKLKSLVVKAWASSARKSYYMLLDLVNDRRQHRDPEYMRAFEWLVGEIECRAGREKCWLSPTLAYQIRS